MQTTILYEQLLEKLDGHPYSNYFSAWCPFDRHKTPALLVHDDGLFVCMSCGKKGTHEFLWKKVGSHYLPPFQHDTVSKVLPRWRMWEEKYGDLEGIAQAAHRTLVRNPNYQTYLKRRKIYEFTNEGCLGYLDSWITFPVFDTTHKVVDIVVRSLARDGDVRYVVHPADSHTNRPIYVPSWEKVTESECVYVVYGIIDAISLHLAGLPVLTGVTGKSLHADLLKPLRKRFIILPDEGEEKDAIQLANKLGWRAKVKKLDYPEDIKDPDGIRRAYGNEKLLQTIGA